MNEKTGIFAMSRSEYDALPDRVNFSTLKLMDQNPAAYLYALLNHGDEDSDARQQGRAVHTRVYEPELFKSTYVVYEDRRDPRSKEWVAFQKTHHAEGHEILTIAMHANVIAIADAVRSSAMAAPFLTGGKREQTMLWSLKRPRLGAVEGYEIPMKGRPDFVRADSIVDLKTCRTARPFEFGRSAHDLLYFVQAALYVDGLAIATNTPPRPYWLIAVESKPPFVVQVYRVTDEQLALGRARYWQWLDTLNVCRQTGEYPGYALGPMDLSLPPWATPKEDIYEEEAA